MTALVRRERRRDLAAGRDAHVVLAATSCAQLRSDMHARVLPAWADAADAERMTEAATHIPGTAAVYLAPDTLDSGATS